MFNVVYFIRFFLLKALYRYIFVILLSGILDTGTRRRIHRAVLLSELEPSNDGSNHADDDKVIMIAVATIAVSIITLMALIIVFLFEHTKIHVE